MSIRVWSGVTIGTVGRKIKQIIDAYPGDKSGLYVTSAYRPGPAHHGGGRYGGSPTAAIDIGFGYGTSGYQARARNFAAWLYRYSGNTVELIVSRVGSGNANGGFYVKNTVRVAPYAHTGSNPSVRHENHVHFACSSAQADRILAQIRAGGGGSSGGGSGGSSGPSQAQIANTPWNRRPTIRRGNSGGAVGRAQFLLRNRLGFNIDNVSGNPFGPQTESAVRTFQQRERITVDGVIGPQTWPRLEVAAAKRVSHSSRPVIRQGSEGEWVGYAQHCLRRAGHSIDNLNGFPFGPQTQRAMVNEQRKYAWLENSGVVATNSWAMLDAIEARQAPKDPNDGVSPPPPPPSSGVNYSAPDSFVSREQWGAHDAKSHNEVALSYWQGITIHHSGGSYSSVKAIQEWMMFNRPNESDRLADVGYSLLIRDGKVHVGRGLHQRPAHDGINTTIGVCVIGNYSNSLPSAQDRAAIVEAIKECEKYVGRKLTIDTHRDRRPTSCPGDALASWVRGELPALLEGKPAEPPSPPEGAAPGAHADQLMSELIELLKDNSDLEVDKQNVDKLVALLKDKQ